MARTGPSRRGFLAAASGGPAAALLPTGEALPVQPAAPIPNKAAARPLAFLMADDFEDLEFMAWRVEPGRPDPHNPLLEPGMPWDSGGVFAHGTVLRDPIDGLWKAWQVSFPASAKP